MIKKMERLKRELVYKGTILDVYKDTMRFDNGKQEEWDFVSHRMGAAAASEEQQPNISAAMFLKSNDLPF